MEDKKLPDETRAYLAWSKYYYGWFAKSGFLDMARQCRNYYQGRQYAVEISKNTIKPTMNITREYVEKCTAKTLETDCALEFTADKPDVDLTTLDEYYEFQMKVIRNKEFLSRLVERGFVDGIGIGATAYDRDDMGSGSDFRGFLRREIIPFEKTFWANPFLEDPQDQKYWGYFYDMEVTSAKDILANEYEGDHSSKEYKEKLKLLAPDDVVEGDTIDDGDTDSKIIRVFYRFFRVNGEVAFECATKYCNLFRHPHALNPSVNEAMLKDMAEEANERADSTEGHEGDGDTHMENDYRLDPARYTLFEKAVKETESEQRRRKRNFSRYPVTVYRPFPISGSILGTSGVSLIIPNQNIINLTYYFISLILQYHAMPVWVVKKGALPGQTIDNSPNKVLVDCSPITSNVQWGVTRLSSGDSINSNLVTVGTVLQDQTRAIYGFTDLVSNTNAGDSGYKYQLQAQQANLVLEQPQRRLWEAEVETAKTDLLYFKHYIKKAAYMEKLEDGEYDYQNAAKSMSQELVASGAVQRPQSDLDQLGQPARRNRRVEVTEDLFDDDFFVSVEAVQGLATSVISEGEEYDKIMTSIMTGNTDAEFLKVYLAGNRNMHFKTKQRVRRALEAYESSDMKRKDEEINQLKQTITQLVATIKQTGRAVDLANMQNAAQQQAFNEQNKTNMAVLKGLQSQQKQSEGEVKSQNSKGIEGGSFS